MYNIEETKSEVKLIGVSDFEIDEILECGQCFRFDKLDKSHYRIVAHNRVLEIIQNGKDVTLTPCNRADFDNIWLHYFDLNTDYGIIKDTISANDILMRDAVEFAAGIRILNQDVWECIISFIISQNNNIPRIKRIIRLLSERYGTEIGGGVYSFPTPEQLAGATTEDLMACNTGFRARYIQSATEMALTGALPIDNFANMSTEGVREALMRVTGIGPKVADCILLFACRRHEVFPTDVWVKRVMARYYFDSYEPNIKEIHERAHGAFGKLAGYAQQYLFHYIRTTEKNQ